MSQTSEHMEQTQAQKGEQASDAREQLKKRSETLVQKLENRPGDLTKGELRKVVSAYRKAHERNIEMIIQLNARIAELKARVTRYAEEAMEQRDQQDPEAILGHEEE